MSADDIDDVLDFDPAKLGDEDLAKLEEDLGDTDAMKKELKAMGIDLENFDDDDDIENDPSKAPGANSKQDSKDVDLEADRVEKKAVTGDAPSSEKDTQKVGGDEGTTKEDEDQTNSKDSQAVTPNPPIAANSSTVPSKVESGEKRTSELSREELLAKMRELQAQHDELKKSLNENQDEKRKSGRVEEAKAPKSETEVPVEEGKAPEPSSKIHEEEKPPGALQAAVKEKEDIAEAPENTIPKPRGRKRAVKVIVVGNSKCGKTSIINRYVKDVFSNEYKYTIGCDYSMKQVQVTPDVCVRLQLWDIAGQDRFIHLSRAFFKKSAGAILVCDVTRPATLEAVRSWKQELDKGLLTEAKRKGTEVPVIMIANKVDLIPDVQKSVAIGADVQRLSEELSLDGWFIGSAKADNNINEAMMFLLKKIIGVEKSEAKMTPLTKRPEEKGKPMAEKQEPALTSSKKKKKRWSPLKIRSKSRSQTLDLSKPSNKDKKKDCCLV